MPKGFRANINLLKAHRRRGKDGFRLSTVDYLESQRTAHTQKVKGSESPFADGKGVYCRMCGTLIAVKQTSATSSGPAFTANKGVADDLCRTCEQKALDALTAKAVEYA